MKPRFSVKMETNNKDKVIKATNDNIHIVLEMIGIQAEKYAKALCPVGTPESTGIKGYIGGRLRNSIAHSVVDSEKAVYIGTNVEYAPYVELGTVKMNARPYLRPAVENHQMEYIKMIHDLLNY